MSAHFSTICRNCCFSFVMSHCHVRLVEVKCSCHMSNAAVRCQMQLSDVKCGCHVVLDQHSAADEQLQAQRLHVIAPRTVVDQVRHPSDALIVWEGVKEKNYPFCLSKKYKKGITNEQKKGIFIHCILIDFINGEEEGIRMGPGASLVLVGWRLPRREADMCTGGRGAPDRPASCPLL